MYNKARKDGATLDDVTIKARTVEVMQLSITTSGANGEDTVLPYFGLECEVGGGTYIRSLIYDLANAAGSVAHMTALTRTASALSLSLSLPNPLSLPKLAGTAGYRLLAGVVSGRRSAFHADLCNIDNVIAILITQAHGPFTLNDCASIGDCIDEANQPLLDIMDSNLQVSDAELFAALVKQLRNEKGELIQPL